jgi:tRNA(Ile)-lysidine synthase
MKGHAARPPDPTWLEDVRTALTPDAGRGVVMAVSGGSDSVGLLRAATSVAPALGLPLCVAHLHHGTRGDAANADASFVAQLSDALGLPCVVGHWWPRREAHFEADARRARLDWLTTVARDRGASAVALAHTRDDQAETILHRVLRGTGPRGLTGMSPRRRLADDVDLVRPLLKVGREEVRAWLASLGQEWREDASNLDTTRTRARLRHDLLSKLAADYNPDVAGALVRLGELAGDENRALDALLRSRLEGVVIESGPGRIILRVAPLGTLPREAIAPLLRLAWRDAGWSEREMDARRWSRLVGHLMGEVSANESLPGVRVEHEEDVVRLTRGSAPVAPVPAPVGLAVPGHVRWGEWLIRALVTESCEEGPGEVIDRDALMSDGSGVLVRAPRAGDRFGPMGLGGHTQSLNDFLRGRSVRSGQRAKVPLVCDRDGIVWVVGHRIADRVRVTEGTRRRLRLQAVLDLPTGETGTSGTPPRTTYR